MGAILTLGDDDIQDLLHSLSGKHMSVARRVELLNASGMYGETPLMAAVLLRSPDTVEMMVDGGANVNAADSSGMTSLMLSAIRGHADILRLLKDAGAIAEARDRDGKTALMHSLIHSKCMVAHILIEDMAWDNAPWYGKEELRMAICMKHADLAAMLIERGFYRETFAVRDCILHEQFNTLEKIVDACMKNRDAESLFLVCTRILKFYCGCGKRCDEESLRIIVALDILIQYGSLKLLDSDDIGNLLLISAERAGPLILTKVLQECHNGSFNVNFAQTDGNTPLMYLIKSFYTTRMDGIRVPGSRQRTIECISILLDQGADVTVRDDNGYTPFHYAVFSMDDKVVEFMLQKCYRDIKQLHWKQFHTGVSYLQMLRKKEIHVSDMDVECEDIPWASGCCDLCRDRKKQPILDILRRWKRGYPLEACETPLEDCEQEGRSIPVTNATVEVQDDADFLVDWSSDDILHDDESNEHDDFYVILDSEEDMTSSEDESLSVAQQRACLTPAHVDRFWWQALI